MTSDNSNAPNVSQTLTVHKFWEEGKNTAIIVGHTSYELGKDFEVYAWCNSTRAIEHISFPLEYNAHVLQLFNITVNVYDGETGASLGKYYNVYISGDFPSTGIDNYVIYKFHVNSMGTTNLVPIILDNKVNSWGYNDNYPGGNLTISVYPILSIVKVDSPDPVQAGGQLTYTIRVNNTGNAYATNVTVNETYDANVSYYSASPSPESGTANRTWRFSSLNVSENKSISITVNVSDSLLNGTLLKNYVNFTYTELNPANYTVRVYNSTATINTTTVNYPVGGTDQVANESFYLNSTAADGLYNVSVGMYDNASNYGISYQNNSVVKDTTDPTITIDTPTTASKVYRKSGKLVKDGQVYVVKKEFPWGLVSLNTKKSIYKLGEIAEFIIVVLDEEGHSVCDADISMTVNNPYNETTDYCTCGGTILPGDECGLYTTEYLTEVEGNHTIDVTASIEGSKVSFETTFSVQQSYEFEIIRTAQSKIDPTRQNWFEVTIDIESFTDARSITLKEFVPAEFDIAATDAVTVLVEDDTKTIIWNKDLKDGKTAVHYSYSVPPVWPYLYALGPAEIDYFDKTLSKSVAFKEARPWYVAVDPEFEHLYAGSSTSDLTITGAGNELGAPNSLTASISERIGFNSNYWNFIMNNTEHSADTFNSARIGISYYESGWTDDYVRWEYSDNGATWYDLEYWPTTSPATSLQTRWFTAININSWTEVNNTLVRLRGSGKSAGPDSITVYVDAIELEVNYTDTTPPTITIDEPTELAPVYRKGGERFYVNFTYTEEHPKNYTVKIRNSTAIINTTTVDYPPGGTNRVANESFYLNSTAADGWYNVSVEMYDNASNYGISYQNNSVVKDTTTPTITIDEPTTSSPVYRRGGELFYVNFTYTELNPANYTVRVYNSTATINTTTVNYPVGGTDQIANESFYLNSSAADGWYNVSVEMYDNASNYDISYQNNSVVKVETPVPSIELNKTVWNGTAWVDAAPANVGEVVRFNLSIHNNGTENLVNITVTDGLPACLIYANNATVNGTLQEPSQSGNNISWNVSALAPCNWVSIEFNATVNSSGICINVVNTTGIGENTSAVVYDKDTATVYGDHIKSCISGFKFNERTGEPLEGWNITVTNVSGHEWNTTTNAFGQWRVCDLEPGLYTVCEELKWGWKQVSPDGCHHVNLAYVNETNINFTNGQNQTNLTVEIRSWDIIGIDSNSPEVGPNQSTVQARICNNGSYNATNVTVNFTWNSPINSEYIYLHPHERTVKNLGTIPSGGCKDVFFIVAMPRQKKIEDYTRAYTLNVTSDNSNSPNASQTLTIKGLQEQAQDSSVFQFLVPPSYRLGETFQVVVQDDIGRNINAAGFPVTYDPAVIELVNVTVNTTGKYYNGINYDISYYVPPRDLTSSENNVTYTFRAVGLGSAKIGVIILDLGGTGAYHYNKNYPGDVPPITVNPNLSIVKVDSPDPVQAGGQLTYTIRVNNTGNANATNVTVNETYDANVTYFNASPPPELGSDNRTWLFSTLNMSENKSITITVNISSSLTNGTLLKNYVNVTCDQNVTNQTWQNTTIITVSDLSIAKYDSSDPVIAGSFLNYTITVTNAGPSDAVNVTVNDMLPPGVTFNSASPGYSAPDPLQWTLARLNASDSHTLWVNLTVNSSTSGVLINTVNVSSSTTDDPVLNNNTAYEETNIINSAIEVEKTVWNGAAWVDYYYAYIGKNVTFNLTITNTGTDPLINITVNDTLPVCLENASWGRHHTWVFDGPLDINQSIYIEFNASVLCKGENINWANVSALGTNTSRLVYDEDNATVFGCPVICVSKTVWDPLTGSWVDSIHKNVGEVVRFNMSIHNNGTENLINITVTDYLPACLVYADNATVNGTPQEPFVGIGNISWNFSDPLAICHWIYIEFNATVNSSGTCINRVNATGIGENTSKFVYDENFTTVFGEGLCVSGYKLNQSSGLGLEGWTVKVYNVSTGLLVGSNVTNATGYWIVCDLPPGTYNVTEVLQPGWIAVDPESGNTSVTLNGVNATIINFTNYKCNGSISDFVWYDTNKNGIQDFNELGIGGVTVKLYQHDGLVQLINTTITNESGFYLFVNVCEGNYSLEFVPPPGFVFTAKNQGSDDLDSNADPSTGRTDVFYLGSGENNPTLDAGLYYQPPLPVPAMTPLGMIALVLVLSAIVTIDLLRNNKPRTN